MKRTPLLLIYLIGTLLLSYTAFRAYQLSFTHDESFTWHNYINNGSVIDILTGNPPAANDHILNSLLMKLFSSLWGNNAFVLRMQSLLAHFLYIICTIGLVSRFKNKWYALASFILLNVNPYMLDFFSLARGYALGNGFLMASIYFIYKYYDNPSKKYLVASMLSIALSVISVFTMIYTFISIIFALNIIILLKLHKKNNLVHIVKVWSKENKPIGIITIVLIILCFIPIRRLIVFHALYWGGQTNLWHDTVLSLIEGSLYNQGYATHLMTMVAYLLTFIIVVSMIFVIKDLLRKSSTQHTIILLLSIFMLLMPMLISQIHHWIANGKYLIWRSTIFYVPLIMWVCVVFFDYFSKKKESFVSVVFVWVFAGILLFNFTESLNFKYVTEWQYDACTKEMLNNLKEDIEKTNVKTPVNLGIHWFFEPTINFYRETQNLKWLDPVNRNGFDMPADYYYIFKYQSKYLDENHKISVKQYPVSETILAKTPK